MFMENGKPLGEDEDLGELDAPVRWVTVEFSKLETALDDSDLLFLMAEKISRRKAVISDTNKYYRAQGCISIPIVGDHPDEWSVMLSALRQAHFILEGVSEGIVSMDRHYFSGGQ
jgi:hypothetical protein